MRKVNKKDIIYYSGLASAVIITVFALNYNQQLQYENSIYFSKPLTDDEVKIYANNDPKTVIIYPILTQNAYKEGGFYDYFKGKCKTCDTVSLRPFELNATYTTGLNSFRLLTQLHYSFITDLFVDKHPELLKDYDTIILLHNEYVTKNEFNAIKNHKSVLYLYPNSLYTEVSVDYDKLTMSLVKGHGYDNTKNPPYPVNNTNGFDYVTSSKGEYDFNCHNYKWQELPNGIQPTCWPEFLIKSDRNFLQIITDYPNKIPQLLPISTKHVDTSSILQCDPTGNCISEP